MNGYVTTSPFSKAQEVRPGERELAGGVGRAAFELQWLRRLNNTPGGQSAARPWLLCPPTHPRARPPARPPVAHLSHPHWHLDTPLQGIDTALQVLEAVEGAIYAVDRQNSVIGTLLCWL